MTIALALLMSAATAASTGPPTPLMKPSWWFPGEGSGWIDFAPRESGHIIIRVTINGEPAWALVDSGFEAMTLSKRYAEAHHLALTPAPGGAAVSFGGDTPLYYAAGVTMTIGGLHTEGPSVFQAVDLAPLSRFDVPLDAVIGLDLCGSPDWRSTRITIVFASSSAAGSTCHLTARYGSGRKARGWSRTS